MIGGNSLQLVLVNKTDVSWWSMRNSAEEVGLVPVNYIDKLEETDSRSKETVPQNQVQENGGDEVGMGAYGWMGGWMGGYEWMGGWVHLSVSLHGSACYPRHHFTGLS